MGKVVIQLVLALNLVITIFHAERERHRLISHRGAYTLLFHLCIILINTYVVWSIYVTKSHILCHYIIISFPFGTFYSQKYWQISIVLYLVCVLLIGVYASSHVYITRIVDSYIPLVGHVLLKPNTSKDIKWSA